MLNHLIFTMQIMYSFQKKQVMLMEFYCLGGKSYLTDHIIFGMEVAARYFSDELDGSVPDTKELKKLRFGNINNTDWYFLVELPLHIGQNPCFVVIK